MLQESITTAAKPGSNIISNWFTLSQRLLWRIGKGTKKCHCNSETHSELTQLSQFKNTKVFLTSLEVLASDDLIFCFNRTGDKPSINGNIVNTNLHICSVHNQRFANVLQNSCFLKFCNIHRTKSVLESRFNKATVLKACFIKKRLQHRCFPVNIAKFL